MLHSPWWTPLVWLMKDLQLVLSVSQGKVCASSRSPDRGKDAQRTPSSGSVTFQQIQSELSWKITPSNFLLLFLIRVLCQMFSYDQGDFLLVLWLGPPCEHSPSLVWLTELGSRARYLQAACTAWMTLCVLCLLQSLQSPITPTITKVPGYTSRGLDVPVSRGEV